MKRRMIQKAHNLSILIWCGMICFACGNDQQSNTKGKDVDNQTTNSSPTPKTADYNKWNNAYFGDLHVHTSWSFDAFIYNVRTTPDDAYRYGKGEPIDHALGKKIQLARPLDFMAVTDHSEYLGVMMQMLEKEHPLSKLDFAKRVLDEDRSNSFKAFSEVGVSLARNQPIAELNQKEIQKSTWDRLVEMANKHNEAGKFTTFPAYEWTSSPAEINHDPTFARNLHRNVIYRGEKVSNLPFSSFDSQNPEELWNWMDDERTKGIDLMAIPHNANMSDGLMFDLQTFTKKELTKAYAESRARNEPINEVVQIKGQSMAHPALAPNDEFADFEIYDYTFSNGVPPRSKPEGSYIRNALQNGLKLEKELGVNPFKFGLIGSSDGHNSAGPVEENNYFGKFGNIDGSAALRLKESDQFIRTRYFSGAGLAGVWAKENTRDAIYEAMERKEVFATSGPRIKVRFFGGWDFDRESFSKDNWLESAYGSSSPMGGDLPKMSTGKKAPTFLVWAVKDAEGANLDRVQVIKSWVSKNGEIKEEIFDVAWSDDRQMGKDMKVPKVGSTVNVKEATYTNAIGAVSLQNFWMDPAFDPSLSAVYYLRVLEIPTPRWSTFDAHTLGVEPRKDIPKTIQERAWSSPIWYRGEL